MLKRSIFKTSPLFATQANIQEVRKNIYILTPGRCIDFAAEVEDEVAFEDKMQKLPSTPKEQMQKATVLDETIKKIKKIGFEICK